MILKRLNGMEKCILSEAKKNKQERWDMHVEEEEDISGTERD